MAAGVNRKISAASARAHTRKTRLQFNFLQDAIEDLGIYIVSFDRPGYGESDPNPNRTLKSLPLDIEELADQLRLGPKFYVVGFSIGGQLIWPCLKYIPHRLAGATLIAPVVNYWWPGFPSNLSTKAYYQQFPQDQWTIRVAHYIPWLTYWWNTQKWFPSTFIAQSPLILSHQDLELMAMLSSTKRKEYEAQIRQLGEYESLHRDLMISFGTWEFDPTDLKKPFPNNEGSVQLWHGDEDKSLFLLHCNDTLPKGSPGFTTMNLQGLATCSLSRMACAMQLSRHF